MPEAKDILPYLTFAGVVLIVVWAIRSGRGLKEVSLTGIGKVVLGDGPKEVELPGLPPGPIAPSPRRYNQVIFGPSASSESVQVLLPPEVSPQGWFASRNPDRTVMVHPDIQQAIDDVGDYARAGEITVFDLCTVLITAPATSNSPTQFKQINFQFSVRLRRRMKWSDGRPACVIEAWFPEYKGGFETPTPYNVVFSKEHGWVAP